MVDDYRGAEGDVRKCGTGLKWLHADMLNQLCESLLDRNTASARTVLAVLDHLACTKTVEHHELASVGQCTPEELRSRNGRLTELIRTEFTGYGWPFGWHYGAASAGEPERATIYEMHPEVAASWRSLRALGNG